MNKPKHLFALFLLVIVSIWGIYRSPQATATFISQSLTIKQSIPNLPGKFALNRSQRQNIIFVV